MCYGYQSRYGRPFFNATLMIFNRLIEPPPPSSGAAELLVARSHPDIVEMQSVPDFPILSTMNFVGSLCPNHHDSRASKRASEV